MVGILKEIKIYQKELNNNGICIISKIFSDEKIVRTRKAVWDVIQGNYETGIEPEERFWNIGDNPKNIIKIDKPHLSNDTIRKLITSPVLGHYLSEITKSNIIQVWHSQSIWKPPGGGIKGNAGWHRDIQYWPFWSLEGVFTAWIALTDVGKDSGPVRFILGSHKWSKLIRPTKWSNNQSWYDDDSSFMDLPPSKEFEKNILIPELSLGDAVLFNFKTVHGSTGNNSSKSRRAFSMRFIGDDVKYIDRGGPTSPPFDGINLKTGDLMRDDWFPKVFSS